MSDLDLQFNEIEEELEDLEGAKDALEDDYDEDQEEDEVIEIDFKNKKVKLNMLKKRAPKAPDITDDIWKLCNKENRAMYDEYFSTQKQLSDDTRKQYRTCLKQFFYFVYTDLNDKPMYKITKRDFTGGIPISLAKTIQLIVIGFSMVSRQKSHKAPELTKGVALL